MTTKIIKVFEDRVPGVKIWQEIQASDKVLIDTHSGSIIRYADGIFFDSYSLDAGATSITESTHLGYIRLTTDAGAVKLSNKCLALLGKEPEQFVMFQQMLYDAGEGWQRYWFETGTRFEQPWSAVVYVFDDELDAIQFKLSM